MARRSDTRERLIEEGMRLLLVQGYSASGVQEITAAAGVPKGSFYNFFSSKEQFALAVLDQYQASVCGRLAAAATAEGRAVERLRAIFDSQRQEFEQSGFAVGCLAGRLSQELAGEMIAVREPLERVFLCMRSYFERLLEEARSAGEVAPGLDPTALADFLLDAWQGAMQRAKAAHSVEPLERFVAIVFDRLIVSLDN